MDWSSALSKVREKASGLDARLDAIEKKMRARRLGTEPYRVLVTGFCDWKGLRGNVWRRRDNPSCRLLVGAAQRVGVDPTPAADGAAGAQSGELTRRLWESSAAGATVDGRPVEFTFKLKPVVWDNAVGPFCAECMHYDSVIHLGLGVYDSTNTILIEQGAFNQTKGTDVIGVERDCAADDRVAAQVLQPAAGGAVPAAIARAIGIGLDKDGFKICGAPARRSNTYLCNQTHWKALRALDLAATAEPKPGRLRSVFFLHIPHPQVTGQYAPLASALHGVIGQLLDMKSGNE